MPRIEKARLITLNPRECRVYLMDNWPSVAVNADVAMSACCPAQPPAEVTAPARLCCPNCPSLRPSVRPLATLNYNK